MAGYVKGSKSWFRHELETVRKLRVKKIIDNGLKDGSVFKARDGKYYEEIINPLNGEIVDCEV